MVITRKQRCALHSVYLRCPLNREGREVSILTAEPGQTCLTYRQFRKMATGTIGMDGAIAIPWCGMWLLIENDGYTHS